MYSCTFESKIKKKNKTTGSDQTSSKQPIYSSNIKFESFIQVHWIVLFALIYIEAIDQLPNFQKQYILRKKNNFKNMLSCALTCSISIVKNQTRENSISVTHR